MLADRVSRLSSKQQDIRYGLELLSALYSAINLLLTVLYEDGLGADWGRTELLEFAEKISAGR